MWHTDTLWFDVAMVMSIFAIGSILFGHFEEHKPKLRRVAKVVAVLGGVLALSAAGQRGIAYTMIVALGLGAAYVHLRWLPKHGINGWTGEPKQRYYDLLGVPENARPGRRPE